MPELDTTLSANRSVELELQDERRLVREGYELLDEKRVLLATEMLRRLAAHRVLQSEWLSRYRQARQMLVGAVAALGLEGVQLYPVLPRDLLIEAEPQRIAGVALQRLQSVRLAPPTAAAPQPVWPSAAIGACAAMFAQVVELAARIAAEEQNLRRLAREYVRTDRRARALENVLLPEFDEALRYVQEQLEYLDTEEAVRVHEAHRRIETNRGN
jgi:V/A-type H+-transporting ATPase subunit D